MPLPGDFGLVSITGTVGRLIRVGQYLNGDGFRDFEHAFVVLNNGGLLEAEPGGARLRDLSEYDGTNVTYSDWPLTDQQRDRIVDAALSLVGTPYSVLDYLSLTLVRLHLRPGWVARYVANTGHMICSQLTDECYARAGVHLFADGRIPGDVTPGDLATVLHAPKT
jgi:hypothetical protein